MSNGLLIILQRECRQRGWRRPTEASISRSFMHRSERNHSMIDIVSRPSHLRHIISPEPLTRASTDCIDRLRNKLVVKWQGYVAHIEESVVSNVERTGGVAGHSPFEHLLRDIGEQYFLGGEAFAMDVGRLASLAFWLSFVALDAPFPA